MMAMSVVAALVVLTQNPINSQQASRDQTELTGLEAVWNDAHLRGDAGALGRLWADDIVITVPRMRVFAKADALGMVGGQMKFDRYETTNIQTRIHGDSAVVTGRLRRTRNVGGKTFDDDWQFTKTYIRSAGQWRVVAFHASDATQ
jgi:ketosteroid isomerase-like protein